MHPTAINLINDAIVQLDRAREALELAKQGDGLQLEYGQRDIRTAMGMVGEAAILHRVFTIGGEDA